MKKAERKKNIIFVLSLLTILSLLLVEAAQAATIQGTIYDADLEIAAEVLVVINTTPMQKMLARDGTYAFTVSPGAYQLIAQKENIRISEYLRIEKEEGLFTFDLFLLPDFLDEDELWQASDEPLFAEEGTAWWRYAIAVAIIIFAFWRIARARKKYGPLPTLWRWGKRKRAEKKAEQHEGKSEKKEEHIGKETTGEAEAKKTAEKSAGETREAAEATENFAPLNEILTILRKHDGRMTQKELRKEMMHLSEAKISLLLTELEHKGKLEKIKRGRGNVVVVRE